MKNLIFWFFLFNKFLQIFLKLFVMMGDNFEIDMDIRMKDYNAIIEVTVPDNYTDLR